MHSLSMLLSGSRPAGLVLWPLAILFVLASASGSPCLDFLSVSLENGTKLENGSVLDQGVVFPPETQFMKDGDLRGCPCLVKHCFRYCCPLGMYYAKKVCNEYPANVSLEQPFPSKLVLKDFPQGSEMSSELVEDNFFTLFSKECRTSPSFILSFGEPDESVGLKLDGTVVLTKLDTMMETYYDVDRYCLTWNVLKIPRFIVCRSEEKITEVKVENTFKWVQATGNFFSVFFLVLTFIVYAMFEELRNIHGLILMSNIASLATAFFLGQIMKDATLSSVFTGKFSCSTLAYIVHFSFLASFFWLNVMCFDIWWTFGGFRSLHGSVKQRERKKFIMYSIYAWGGASLITATCMIMDLAPFIPPTWLKPEFGTGSCWFGNGLSGRKARFFYFYMPMGITVICNICLFVLTALKILKHKKDTARQLKGSDSRRHDDNKQWFNLYLKLFIVMGINWSTEIISWALENEKEWKFLWYITDLANTLQGVIIFVIFVWKDKIKRLLMKRLGCTDGNFLSRNSTSRNCATTTSMATSRTMVTTAAPLTEKANPHGYGWKVDRGKTNVTFDESDGV